MFRTITKRVLGLARPVGSRLMSEVDVESAPTRFEKSVNMVNLLGRVGRDAEMRGSEEHPVVVFSLATSAVYTRSDGKTVARTDWHRVSVFKPGLREKVAANIRKGDRIFVTGTLRYDDYVDSNEMRQRTVTVIANDLVNITKRYLSEGEIDDAQDVM